MAFRSIAVSPARASLFLVATLLAAATRCRAEFNFEVGLRVQERLEEYIATPTKLLAVIAGGQANGALPSPPERDAFLLLGDTLLASYPHWMIYYGLENGELTGNFHTPRLGEYRAPGNGGYLVADEAASRAHYDTCVAENGTAVPCRMSVGDQYVACIDDCNLQPCEREDGSPADCSALEEGGDEKARCEEQLKWCPTYEIKTVTESDAPRGYIPLYEYCLGQSGLPSQAEGVVYKFHDGVAGSCYYNDKTTLVNRSDSVDSDYCNKMKDSCSLQASSPGSCHVTAGAFQQFNYDPRYRPWYIDAKKKQRPYWTSPFVFFDPPDLGSTYVHPFYSTNNEGKRVFEGVLALDYKFLDIANFLTVYEDSDTVVAIVEEASPNYLIATSEGGIGSKRVSASDETRPCPEDGGEDCKTVRVQVGELEDTVSLAFATHMAQDFPAAKLVPISFDGAVYASQTLPFASAGNDIQWRVLILSPVEARSEDTISASDAQAVGVLAPALGGAIVCLVFLGYLVKHRRQREVATSDVRFTGAFIFGCVLLNLACLSFLGENTDELCLLRMWVLPFCFVLALAPLLVKTYRMYVLIGNAHNFSRQSLSHAKTALMMTPFIAVEVLILLIFTFVDPSRETEVIEQDGSAVSYRVVCSHDTEAFFAVQLAYAGGLLLVGCYLAFKSRNMEKEFSDAKPLVIAMYNIAVVTSLVLIVAKIVDIPDGALRILVAAAVAWSTVFSGSVFILPRLLQNKKRVSREKRESQASSDQYATGGSGWGSGAAMTSEQPKAGKKEEEEEKEEES